MGGPTPDGKNSEKVYLIYQQLRTDPEYPQYFRKDISGFHSPGNVTTMIQGVYCKVLKLKPDQPEVTADIILKRSSTFALKVQDPDGSLQTTWWRTTSRDWMYAMQCEGDNCTVYDLEKGSRESSCCAMRSVNLAATMTLKGRRKGTGNRETDASRKVKACCSTRRESQLRSSVHLSY